MIISHLNHYFENNKEPILAKKESDKKEENINKEMNETVEKIIEVLDTKISQQ